MAASDYAHWDSERQEYGYFTGDGAWHRIEPQVYDDFDYGY